MHTRHHDRPGQCLGHTYTYRTLLAGTFNQNLINGFRPWLSMRMVACRLLFRVYTVVADHCRFNIYRWNGIDRKQINGGRSLHSVVNLSLTQWKRFTLHGQSSILTDSQKIQRSILGLIRFIFIALNCTSCGQIRWAIVMTKIKKRRYTASLKNVSYNYGILLNRWLVLKNSYVGISLEKNQPGPKNLVIHNS